MTATISPADSHRPHASRRESTPADGAETANQPLLPPCPLAQALGEELAPTTPQERMLVLQIVWATTQISYLIASAPASPDLSWIRFFSTVDRIFHRNLRSLRKLRADADAEAARASSTPRPTLAQAQAPTQAPSTKPAAQTTTPPTRASSPPPRPTPPSPPSEPWRVTRLEREVLDSAPNRQALPFSVGTKTPAESPRNPRAALST